MSDSPAQIAVMNRAMRPVYVTRRRNERPMGHPGCDGITTTEASDDVRRMGERSVD